eukprot:2515810-Rhodomonas_salina.3
MSYAVLRQSMTSPEYGYSAESYSPIRCAVLAYIMGRWAYCAVLRARMRLGVGVGLEWWNPSAVCRVRFPYSPRRSLRHARLSGITYTSFYALATRCPVLTSAMRLPGSEIGYAAAASLPLSYARAMYSPLKVRAGKTRGILSAYVPDMRCVVLRLGMLVQKGCRRSTELGNVSTNELDGWYGAWVSWYQRPRRVVLKWGTVRTGSLLPVYALPMPCRVLAYCTLLTSYAMPGTALRFGAVSLCLCYAMSATAIIEGVVLFAHVSTMQCPILDGAICVRARSAVRSTNMWSRPRRLLRDARYSHAVWYYQGPITLLTIHEQNENPAILLIPGCMLLSGPEQHLVGQYQLPPAWYPPTPSYNTPRPCYNYPPMPSPPYLRPDKAYTPTPS